MRLEDLETGRIYSGLVPGADAEVVALSWHGNDAVGVIVRAGGEVQEHLLYRSDESRLERVVGPRRSFDAPADDFKLAAEALRIRTAASFDDMLAVATSNVDPLPHQLRAVYGELLPRTPLRFLLADDPGAGKTIMAGLYVKELLLRDDVHRCLIVAPGGLVEQWQDELTVKFGLRFELLSTPMIDAQAVGTSVFDDHPLLIARMDQLARNEVLLDQLGRSEWDLVVVDEAHRMGARWYGAEVKRTRRFALGELLGDVARHLLLMTATPHAGKEDDFQLFLTLLDRDRFEGRQRRVVDTSDVMRRMVKEDLLRFDGTPLFPERVAQTVPYELSALESDLYEDVTRYVREGMNRADQLDGARRTTVGFALTVLQRRLASSPAAIHESLKRRQGRLRRRRAELVDGVAAPDAASGGPVVPDDLDEDELSAEELESIESELVDGATAARTIGELEVEIAELDELIGAAGLVRSAETDRKWAELRTILTDEALGGGAEGRPRKIIVFTEHRDTLDYLTERTRSLLGRAQAVEAIHGGVRRDERRRITEEFTQNPECRVLIATDAAGEGLNLQAAHLVVNYDLPWNPNRIEQRFGRVHRIGQREVCRLWNLVASNTREGEVFTKLLGKIEEQQKAYGGKVFDVLGAAFEETPLRTLLLDAIRYGEEPAVRARMEQVIDGSVAEGLDDLLAERALSRDLLGAAEVNRLRREMVEARARRLQPHYVEMVFRSAFSRLGGRISRREAGRFEIAHVPGALRGPGRAVATRYERVTFDLDRIDVPDAARAELLAPGHPLLDAVLGEVDRQWGTSLVAGTVLVSRTLEEPRLLVSVREAVVDAAGGPAVAQRFGHVLVGEDGSIVDAGPAPYLDCVALPDGPVAERARGLTWVGGAERGALSWVIGARLPEFVGQVRTRRAAELERVGAAVTERLQREMERLATEAMVASEKETAGLKPKEGSASLNRKSEELAVRLSRRLELLERQQQMGAAPPVTAAAALVVPVSWLDEEPGAGIAPEVPPAPHAVETKEVERRGVEAVLAAERALGRVPEEQAFNNPGFDVLSTAADGDVVTIEVKARLVGKDDFFVSHNEVLTGKNAQPHYRLAIVAVDPRGPEHDEVRYVAVPFSGVELPALGVAGVTLKWKPMWERGQRPF
ncbi:MAG TPA: helicase-related protein [Nocardioides sp.]